MTIIPFRICDNDSCGLHAAKKTASSKFVFFTALISFHIVIISTNQAKVSVSDVDNKSGPMPPDNLEDPYNDQRSYCRV